MKPTVIAGLSLAAALVAYFVWPTPYFLVANGNVVKRVHRLSGVEEYSSSKGWMRGDGTLVDSGMRDVTPQLKVVRIGPGKNWQMWEVLVRNDGESLEGIKFHFSILGENGVVIDTSKDLLDELRQGDQRLLNVIMPQGAGSISTIRLDRALAN